MSNIQSSKTGVATRLFCLVGFLWSVVAFSACRPYTVVTFAEATRIAEGEAFDANSFVESRWPEVVSTILERSADLSTVLSAIEVNANGQATKENLQQVASQYGLTTEGQAHVFMVKGQGVVTAVDTESSRGMMEVALQGYEGPLKVKILIGPRLPSDETSVRDAVGFIQFGDFRDQTEFGKVARELNSRIIRDVLGGLDRETLMGKHVTFYGAFTIRTQNIPGDIDVSEIFIVPIQLEVEGA
ncbi:DUF2291 domain-containing protein [Litorilinea aerophila]|nr:DUF2291 domain-containing protein [Litorilinea aerophila]MCC9075642.1 DUF2291 domain-containing protein [Litorilinea aerophila]